jgi:hypothetical protein
MAVRTEPGLPLSRREREIARLAASGLTNRQFAKSLSLSVRTVECHLVRVRENWNGPQDQAHPLADTGRPWGYRHRPGGTQGFSDGYLPSPRRRWRSKG